MTDEFHSAAGVIGRERVGTLIAHWLDVDSVSREVLRARGWDCDPATELWTLRGNPETRDGLVLADALRYELL